MSLCDLADGALAGDVNDTTRAALTGLRKEGHEFAKSKNAEGETVYRTEKAPKAGAKDAG